LKYCQLHPYSATLPLQAHPWFSIPHAASDDWVLGFASLVLNTLRPDLKVYIEYSNEVWNNGFPQHAHAAAMGQQLNLSSVAADAAVRYHKLRSLQVRVCARACVSMDVGVVNMGRSASMLPIFQGGVPPPPPHTLAPERRVG
jgi:hypothetical protein